MKAKILSLNGLLTLAALTISAGASAQYATYDFKATVTSSDFAGIADGTTITGTYTINLGNADLSSDGYSFNTINSTYPWLRGDAGGAAFGNIGPPEKGPVFTSSFTVGNSTFDFPVLSPFGNATSVAGGQDYYDAYDTEYTSKHSYVESNLSVENPTGTVPFFSNGLLNFGSHSVGTGSIVIGTDYPRSPTHDSSSTLDYSITAIQSYPAPEIDAAYAAGGLTLLLGSIVVLRGRRVPSA